MSEIESGIGWLKSDAARRALRVSGCDLSHIRETGKLRFRKKGNAFLYDPKDIERVASGRDNGKSE